MGKFLKRLGIVIALLIGLILAAVLTLTVITALENHTAGAAAVEGSASWMEALSDDSSLGEVNLPGTHDSATQYVQLSFFSKCQGLSIGEQLDGGFRYLDIRLGEEETEEGYRLKLMHGFTTCKTGIMPWSETLYLEDVLEDCYAFLKENPSETIIFTVKYEHGDLPVKDFQNLLQQVISENEDLWYLENRMPKMGEVRGKVVLARRYEDEANLGEASGLSLIWQDQPGSDDVSQSVAFWENGSHTLVVQDRYEYDIEDKWNAYLAGVEEGTKGSDTVHLNFLSTKGSLAYGHPYHYAKALNKTLLEYEARREDFYGWTIVDFGNAGLAEKIYKR